MKPLKRFSPLEGARMLKRAMALSGIGLFVSIASLAQFDLGSVVGTVRDHSGLAMPNAAVEIKSLATNVTRQTVTSAIGDFVAANTSKNFRRAWAKQATCVTRGG